MRRVNHIYKFKIKLVSLFNLSVYSVAVKFDGEDMQIQVDNGDWQDAKVERVQDGSRLKIRANINSNVTTYNASIDGTSVSLFSEVRIYFSIDNILYFVFN